jgi:cell wall-associated NlpC family hydrolase
LVPQDLDGLQRGDLVYWKGHCGIMVDGVLLLHANAHHMQAVIEPLAQVVRRARKAHETTGQATSEIVGIRRLAELGWGRRQKSGK